MSEISLSSRLRDATQAMHRIAETSHFMRKMLKGQLAAPAYCLFLRNLYVLYDALESELDHHAHHKDFDAVNLTALYRSTALAHDLDQLHGSEWQSLPVALAMQQYVQRIRNVSSCGSPVLLAAHAYVRYMGDLSGGQILAEIINRAFALSGQSGLAFYRFDADPISLKTAFRAMLDELSLDQTTADEIVSEANRAFEHHVRLFEELDRSAVMGH
jgi:heme oxygenase (biliverdin-producing, ferredoxin)